MTHNSWLAWKMRVGLAPKGRGGKLSPRGLVAHVLYYLWFRWTYVIPPPNPGERKPQVFKQTCGGGIGPAGSV